VLVVGLAGGSPADGAGAGGVPDLGQVPQPDARVVAAGQVPGQVEQRAGGGAGLGQHAGQLVVGELLIGLRHPPRRFGLTAVLRVAAIQFRDGGELAGGHVGFKAVPRGQHSEQLII